MSLVRSCNPVWFFDNLVGQPFDDTYYAFFLTNTLPYIPQAVYQDPNGTSPWNSPLEFNASSGLPPNVYFNPNQVYRIEFRQGPNQTDPLIFLVEDYVPSASSGTVNPGTLGQLAYYAANGSVLTGGQIDNVLGTATNDNAPAGYVGEYIKSTVLAAGAVALTTTTSANVTSISLTAGDWSVSANVATLLGSGTTTSTVNAWIGTTSATPPTIPNEGAYVASGAYVANAVAILPVGTMRLSLAGTTTVYLSVNATFATSTLAAYGSIGARRIR